MKIQHLQAALAKHNLPLINGREAPDGQGELYRESPLGIPLPAQVICATSDIEAAVTAADRAFRFGPWKDIARKQRKKILLLWADLLTQQLETLSLFDCVETGRALDNFRQDSIPKAIETLRWFAELVDKVEDRSIFEGQVPNNISLIRREPLGVVAVILPWNDPLVVYIWKVAPALICGNAVIVKTSEFAHHSLILATKLAYEAGIPVDILQLVTGDGILTGTALVKHPNVAAIGFTGSSQTGKKILVNAHSNSLKRVNLECGGKGAYIVSDQCNDISAAARCLARNAFYNQGQICSASTRAYIHREVYEEFLNLLYSECTQYMPSDPIDGKTGIGYMIHQHAVERVYRIINRARDHGHNLLSGGDVLCDGRAIMPTVFTNVPDDSEISREELFGPVLTVNMIDSVLEGVTRANDSTYGLACAIWSDDLQEVMMTSAKLHSGVIHVNSYGNDGIGIPFGGVRDSGQGREKSADSLDSYSFTKSISFRLNNYQ